MDHYLFVVGFAWVVCFGFPMCAAEDPLASLDTAAMLERSVLEPGNQARLQRVMAKARRGEPITVGVIGGSITQGAGADKPHQRYGNLVAKWWEKRFPKARIQFVNAGVGGTPSRWGVFRAQRDLLKHKPDFVIVEFGVNDSSLQGKSLPYLEGLVRQVLTHPKQPALMLLFMMNTYQGQRGRNVQHHHRRIGDHYGLPMVSFRDAVYPEIEAGRIAWEDMLADRVHPNTTGHAFAARTVTSLLDGVAKALPEDDGLPAIPRVPEAVVSSTYARVGLYRFDTTKPVRNNGWNKGQVFGYPCWTGSQPGSTIAFTVEGTGVYVMAPWGNRYGNMTVTVDGGEPVRIENDKTTRYKSVPGQYRVAQGLEPGPHEVVVRIGAKTAKVATTRCTVFAIGVMRPAEVEEKR